MNLFLSCIPEEFVVEHNIFPSDSFIKLKLDFVDFVSRLHVDKEISVIEDCINKEIWTIFNVKDFSSWRFYEQVLSHSTFSFLE